MKKVLITGVTGQVGYDVKRIIEEKFGESVEILAPTRKEMDIISENSVKEIVTRFQPDVIFHCAAYTNVDKAESDSINCLKTNIEGTKNLVKGAKMVDAKFIFVSTDYVFDGKKEMPYFENDIREAQNIYGESKRCAENIVKQYPKSFIARTSWVFGKNGNNFVDKMLELSKTHDTLTVIDDQIGSPTYSYDLANKLVEMADTEKYGVYHVTNEGYTSWYDFAKKIFEYKCLKTEVLPIKTVDYKQPAKRPLNSRLFRNNLAIQGFESLPRWEDALRRYLVELCYKVDPETGIITFENGTTATPTDALDAYVINPRAFNDGRGYFEPFFIREYMEALGFSTTAQTNRSQSSKNVLRGLHFQEEPYAQAKIVEVVKGKAIDVIVDIRKSSPTYGKTVSLLLTPYDKLDPESGKQLFVPRGFAHGFISLEDDTTFQYLIDNKYAPKFEGGILWSDEVARNTWDEIFKLYNIDPSELVLSDKDQVRPSLEESPNYFNYKKRTLGPNK